MTRSAMHGRGDPLAFLMSWYSAQCNEDWEHQHGVKIGTLDNPGWVLEVALTETDHEGRVLLMTHVGG